MFIVKDEKILVILGVVIIILISIFAGVIITSSNNNEKAFYNVGSSEKEEQEEVKDVKDDEDIQIDESLNDEYEEEEKLEDKEEIIKEEKDSEEKKEEIFEEEKIVEEKKEEPIVKDYFFYYIPHPDDEVLTMGVSIINNIRNYGSANTYLVLYTRGESSGAIKRVNDRLLDEQRATISTDEFVKSRLLEYNDALDYLGVRSNNRFFYDFGDGSVSVNEVKYLISKYENKFDGNVHHKVFSSKDLHPDHSASGKAARYLFDKGDIDFVKLFVSQRYWDTIAYDKQVNISSNNRSNLDKALLSYSVWDPDLSRYSVGFKSVFASFETMLNTNYNRYKLLSRYVMR